MPDELTPLFEEMRRRALPRVTAPGPAAARRTVHRRNTVLAAAAAAVVMAAGATFIVGRRADVDGAGLTAASPTASASPGVVSRTEVAAVLVPGFSQADVLTADRQEAEMDADSGRYRLRMGCAGPESMTARIQRDQTLLQDSVVDCTEAGVVRDYEVTMPEAGRIHIIFEGGRLNAYALRLSKI